MKRKSFQDIIRRETSKFFTEMSSMAGGAVEGGPVRKKKRRSVVQEGGNAIEGAVAVTKSNFDTIIKNLKAIIPDGVKFQPIGSAGKKEVSGDMDIIIDLEQIRLALGIPEPENKKQAKLLGKNVRIELEKLFQQAGLVTMKSGISVHAGIPTGEGNNIAQVDMMVVPNADEVAPLHQHDYSENPQMKGSTIHGILAALTNAVAPPAGHSIPEGQKSYYKLSPYIGLMTRSPSELITSNKDEIAKIIIHSEASAKDLSSVRNMLRALKRLTPEKYQLIINDDFLKDKIKDDLNLQESLNEAKVGREYQHLEDLLIIDGTRGGIEAIELLEQISAKPQVADFKWDGGSSVFWGRDANGTFIFAPKNQWSKNLVLDREGLASEIENTGRQRKGESPESFKAGRKQLADKYKRLWDIFEAGTPRNFKGFLNGDIMFETKQTQNENGNYVFTPNKVTYTVSPDGLFGKMPTAEAFVVVHGLLSTPFGSEVTGNLKPIKQTAVMAFNKTPGLIVLPTQKPKIKPLDTSELNEVRNSISANSREIDLISNFKAPKFSNFKGILYTYAVNRAKTGDSFMDWLEGSKLSQNQKNTARSFVTENSDSFKTFWGVFSQVVAAKESVLNKIFSGHGQIMQNELGISASIGEEPGGEGIVVARKDGGFGKLINPAFRKAGVNQRFQSMNEEMETNKIVISWGRGMGHKGHMALARAAFKYADKIGAKPIILLSKSFDKKNPLPVEQKLDIYHKVFPGREEDIMIAPEGIPSIFKFLGKLREEGHYQDITVIVGKDQVDNFKGIEKNNNKERHFEKLRVISRQQAVGKNDPDFNFDGPRATNMRNVLKDPEASKEEEFRIWRDAMPNELEDDYIKGLITTAKENMGLLENTKMKRKDFLNEQELRDHIREAIKVSVGKRKLSVVTEEEKLRNIIRMLVESERPEASPHASTGINVLEDLLKKIIPVLEQDFKQLTTEPGQRESFRAHIINAVQNALAPEQAIANAGQEGLAEGSGIEAPKDLDDMVSHFNKVWGKSTLRSTAEPRLAYFIIKKGDNNYNIAKMVTKGAYVGKEMSKEDAIKYLDKNLYRNWRDDGTDIKYDEPQRRSVPRDEPDRRSQLRLPYMKEDVDIDVGGSPEDDDAFIDIDPSSAEIPEADPKDDFGLDGEEVTGRNFSFATFQKIQNQIVDSYSLLDNAADRTLFFDYLITNLKLYFDKFEDELHSNLHEPTTPEYEQEKGQQL